MTKPVIPLTLILVGDSGVGKTCLARQLINKRFDEATDSTVGIEMFRSKMDFDQCVVDLTLKDTCGQEQYRSIVAQFYRDSQGALIVYDITSRQSFETVQEWISNVCQLCPQGVKVMILGNKVDLEMDSRIISFEEGQTYAKENGYPFFETSAKLNVKVESSFRELVQSILQSRNFQQEAPQSTSEPVIVLQKPKQEQKENSEQVQPQKKDGCC
ncbi:rab8, putative [Entamoeba invadens IP1]|uniref:rab8, putative n=1 Tax=Entamoeba invadens IP1 TaxID=370355 RepID=UPI0002C3E3D6|nr:rab8, putative [Entamoeba invadens IP1]ELP85416.1 rab8, putative [Entamoeba invadens IP1]|eukprot:XP_004184762.1 rab8, putative [Entamoeba invadens IP1]